MVVEKISTFEQFINLLKSPNGVHQKKYVFVDFYATWCGPCKRIAPDLEKFSEKYNNNIYYVKVDVDECPEIAEKYDISGLPTFCTFDVGSENLIHIKIMGADKTKIEDKLKQLENDGVNISDDF